MEQILNNKEENMLKECYSVFVDTPKYVIVKKTDDKLLAMKNDLPSAKYIRITKGHNHTLSMYDEDFNRKDAAVDWGDHGFTLISSDFREFRNNLVRSLYIDHGVVIERNSSGIPVLIGGFGINGKFVPFK